MKTIWCILLVAVAVNAASYSMKAAVSRLEGSAQITVSGSASKYSNESNRGTHQ